MSSTPRSILRRKAVREQTGHSDSTIDRMEAAGKLPQRVILGPNSVGWYADEIANYVNNLPRGRAPAASAAAARKSKRERTTPCAPTPTSLSELDRGID